MKASALIHALESEIAEHGDLDCAVKIIYSGGKESISAPLAIAESFVYKSGGMIILTNMSERDR